MISDDQTSPAVSLDDMPSAQAGVASDLLPDAKPLRRRRSIVGFLAKSLLLLALLCVVGLGVIYYLIASGPVSNEKLKAAVESQLTNLLGEGRAAQLGDISFTLGKSGLIAVDARDIRLTENDKTNLGIASQAAVSLKAWPLVTGQFVAKKIAVTGASVALPIETEAPSGAVTQKAALKP